MPLLLIDGFYQTHWFIFQVNVESKPLVLPSVHSINAEFPMAPNNSVITQMTNDKLSLLPDLSLQAAAVKKSD